MSKYQYPATVEDIAKIFDIEKPGWEQRINLKTLDITHCEKCPLSQIYGRYSIEIMRQLWGTAGCGGKLSSNSYQQDWVNAINRRLVSMTFGEAMQAIFDGKKMRHKSFGEETYIHKVNTEIQYSYGDLAENFFPEWKDGWFEHIPPLTLSDLKPGEKFKLKQFDNDDETIYTKTDMKINDGVLVIYNTFKMKSIDDNYKVERVV